MADTITSPPYRTRYTFPDLTTTVIDIAIVGGQFPETIGDVAVGNVSVGEQDTTAAGSYFYRNRYSFDESELTP